MPDSSLCSDSAAVHVQGQSFTSPFSPAVVFSSYSLERKSLRDAVLRPPNVLETVTLRYCMTGSGGQQSHHHDPQVTNNIHRSGKHNARTVSHRCQRLRLKGKGKVTVNDLTQHSVIIFTGDLEAFLVALCAEYENSAEGIRDKELFQSDAIDVR